MKKTPEGSYNLRTKQRKSIFECYNVKEEDLENNDEQDKGWNHKRLREKKKKPSWNQQQEDFLYNLEESEGHDSDIFDDNEVIDKLP